MTRLRISPRGYVVGCACLCGSPLLALPRPFHGYVCENSKCDEPALSAAEVFRALNPGRPALAAVVR